MAETDSAKGWDALGGPLQRALELAWESTCAGSFGIGAVITTDDGDVIATGRNRILETEPGDDVLCGNSLAHAEMNALAKLRFHAHSDQHLVLHTTLEPCVQCTGAIRMSQISEVRVLAPDPLFTGMDQIAHINDHLASGWPKVRRRSVDEWSVFAALLPTHLGSFWGSAVPRWNAALPGIAALADELAATGELVQHAVERTPVPELVEMWWSRLHQCVPELAALSS